MKGIFAKLNRNPREADVADGTGIVSLLCIKKDGALHPGIPTLDGTVIHNSRKLGAVVEETRDAFAEGLAIYSIDFPTDLSSDQVVENARVRLGRRYSSLRYNCQQFVADALGQKAVSKQLRRALVLGLTGFTVSRMCGRTTFDSIVIGGITALVGVHLNTNAAIQKGVFG